MLPLSSSPSTATNATPSLSLLNRAHHQQRAPSAAPPPPPLECDYDVRPTDLYKRIQAKQWDRVLELLEDDGESGGDSQGGGGASRAAERAARTWVVRKEPNGQLRWRLLPLHASLIFGAPYEVVEALVAANPAAAAAKDDQGMIPLHLSLRNHPVDWRVVEELLAANPGGVGTKDRKGRTPLQGAGTSAKAGTAAGAAPDPALGVLKLYTQIAVARERASILAATTTSAGAAAPVVSTPGAASAAVGSSSTIAPAEAAQNPLDLAGALLDLQRQVEEEREAWKIKVRQVEEAAQTKVEASLRAQAGLREQLDSALQQLENAQEASIDPAFPFSRDNRNECESAEEWKGLCLRLLRQHERALDNSSRLWKAADSHRQESEQLEAEIRCVREEARVLLLTPTTPNTVADAAREQDILAAAASSRSDLDRRRRSRSSGTSKYSSNDHLEEKKDTCRSERQPPLQSGAEPSFSDLPNSVLSTARSEVNSVDHLL